MFQNKGGQKKHVSKNDIAKIHIPISRVATTLRQDLSASGIRVANKAASYVAGLMEYVAVSLLSAAELELDEGKVRILPKHIHLGIKKDPKLQKLFPNTTIVKGGVLPFVDTRLLNKKKETKKQKSNDDERKNLGQLLKSKSTTGTKLKKGKGKETTEESSNTVSKLPKPREQRLKSGKQDTFLKSEEPRGRPPGRQVDSNGTTETETKKGKKREKLIAEEKTDKNSEKETKKRLTESTKIKGAPPLNREEDREEDEEEDEEEEDDEDEDYVFPSSEEEYEELKRHQPKRLGRQVDPNGQPTHLTGVEIKESKKKEKPAVKTPHQNVGKKTKEEGNQNVGKKTGEKGNQSMGKKTGEKGNQNVVKKTGEKGNQNVGKKAGEEGNQNVGKKTKEEGNQSVSKNTGEEANQEAKKGTKKEAQEKAQKGKKIKEIIKTKKTTGLPLLDKEKGKKKEEGEEEGTDDEENEEEDDDYVPPPSLEKELDEKPREHGRPIRAVRTEAEKSKKKDEVAIKTQKEATHQNLEKMKKETNKLINKEGNKKAKKETKKDRQKIKAQGLEQLARIMGPPLSDKEEDDEEDDDYVPPSSEEESDEEESDEEELDEEDYDERESDERGSDEDYDERESDERGSDEDYDEREPDQRGSAEEE